jgi:hypothetical protein
MAEYYFIGTALPPLAIGVKPELSFKELYSMLTVNVSSADLEKVDHLLWSIDLSNIRAFWMGLPLDDRGKFSAKELEEALLVKDGLPEYLIDFLDRYDSTEERLRFFPSLNASFYREMIEKLPAGFLKSYFMMEREIRLVLTALRAKSTGRDVARELQFEDPMDVFVMDILSQKDSHDYVPPSDYESLKALYLNAKGNPKELHRALLEYRFQKVEEMEENEHFSMDRILGYLVRLMIVEAWESLNESQGLATTEHLSNYG